MDLCDLRDLRKFGLDVGWHVPEFEGWQAVVALTGMMARKWSSETACRWKIEEGLGVEREWRWRSSISCLVPPTGQVMVMQDWLVSCICDICWELRAALSIEFGSSWKDEGKVDLISEVHLRAGVWQTGRDSERSALGCAVHSPCSTEDVKSELTNYFYFVCSCVLECWPQAEVMVIQACGCCLSQLLLAGERELRQHVTTDMHLQSMQYRRQILSG